MSGVIGLTTELLALVAEKPGRTSAELFEASQVAEKREQVYQAMFQLKSNGRVEKVGKGYRITAKGLEGVPKRADLGWAEEPEQKSSAAAPKAAPQSPDATQRPVPPPAVPDPDRPPPRATVRTCQPTGELFREFLDTLLTACKAESSPALQELAKRVEKHKPEGMN